MTVSALTAAEQFPLQLNPKLLLRQRHLLPSRKLRLNLKSPLSLKLRQHLRQSPKYPLSRNPWQSPSLNLLRQNLLQSPQPNLLLKLNLKLLL